jgi:hypothetical protein
LILHPFAGHLKDWKQGVLVHCGPAPWTLEAINLLVVEQGAHSTARILNRISLVHEDVAYQVQPRFSEIVLWSNIKHVLPQNFKISPALVVPQPNQRRSILFDLSFPMRRRNKSARRRHKMGEIIQALVNNTSFRPAPTEAIKAIGQLLPNLFQFMAGTQQEEVIAFLKIDLSDGFWQMRVEASSKWHFYYVMPNSEGCPACIVVPSALQMGWAKSPPCFCTAVHAGWDIIE